MKRVLLGSVAGAEHMFGVLASLKPTTEDPNVVVSHRYPVRSPAQCEKLLSRVYVAGFCGVARGACSYVHTPVWPRLSGLGFAWLGGTRKSWATLHCGGFSPPPASSAPMSHAAPFGR